MSYIHESNGHKYLTKTLIETGTHEGRGIQNALDLGFQFVRSCEWNSEFLAVAKRRYADKPNVKLYHGLSTDLLPLMLADIREPVTIFLDAHYSECPGTEPPGVKRCPLLEELAQIHKHPVKTHNILIDDIFCCDSPVFGFLPFTEVVRALLTINSAYRLSLEPVGRSPYALAARP